MMPSIALARGNVLLSLMLAGGLATAGPPASTNFSYSVAPLYHFDSGLEDGGKAGFAGVFTSLGGSWKLGGGSSLGMRLSFDYEDWRFDEPQGFGGLTPWTNLYRLGVSLPYSYATEDGWLLSLTPTLMYSGESDADFSKALEYGATATLARKFGPDLTLGLGVAAFARIEETKVFPFLIVNWNITDRLRLTNPFAAGPAGPAGLELAYRLDGDWEAGLGATYRSYRQRLAEDGPFPDGVGENQYIPVYVHVGRNLTDTIKLRLYAGAALGGQLRVENEAGDRLYEEDQDPAAMLGLALIGRF